MGGNAFEAGGMPGGFGGFGGFGGMPGGGGGRSFHFSTGGGGSGFQFSNAEDIFAQFAKGGGGMGGGDDDPLSAFFGNGAAGGFGGRKSSGRQRSDMYSQMGRRAPTPDVTTVEKPLNVSLEELYSGVKKKMKIKRKTFDPATGKRSVQDKILEMEVKPGMKAGSKFKFRGVGDQEEGGSQDMHFIVTEVSTSSDMLIQRHTKNRTETPPNIHPRKRQPNYNHYPRPQRRPHRLV